MNKYPRVRRGDAVKGFLKIVGNWLCVRLIIACDGLLEVLKLQTPPQAHPCTPEPRSQGPGSLCVPAANTQQRSICGQCPAPRRTKKALIDTFLEALSPGVWGTCLVGDRSEGSR